ncbi:flavin reductase [Chthonobacter albigriseus]|uniref:flavin reductase n=1 Tax=Chthonobacter albigriseus TaxID=1683161 RepID=UPI001FCF11AB|nr:flavin reductase [Chthonobacter albigriseus]
MSEELGAVTIGGGDQELSGAMPAVAGQLFRDCIARVPSAVHVITTDGEAGRCGFTATAFASVSDDPPTVLVCLNRKSSQNPIFKANGRFAVNLMAAGTQAIADVFAGRAGLSMAERFTAGHWDTLVTGAPVLAGAIGTMDCLLVEVAEVGTHTVMFGRVVGIRTDDPTGAVLTYHDRRYGQS